MDLEAKIIALGSLCGISPEYLDNFGACHKTPLATYQAFLTAMGVHWEDPARLDQEIRRRRLRPWSRLLEPVLAVFPETGPRRIMFSPWLPGPCLPKDFRASAELTGEDGETRLWRAAPAVCPQETCRTVGEGLRARLALPLPPDLALGYYNLKLRVSYGGREETGAGLLIVAPDRTYCPESLAGGQKYWGLNLPLYAVRSPGNWGIGDFTDLGEALDWAGELGAAFVGVNPLHAPAPQAEADPSPYSPSTRLFLNFLYLDLEKVPELAASPEARALLAQPGFQARLNRLRDAELVDYAAVFDLKRQVLKIMHRAFAASHQAGTPRGQEFARFTAAAGPALTRFSQYQALAEFLGQADWRGWPAAYHNPAGRAVAAYTRDHPEEIAFQHYVQWLAAGQLDQARERARQQGLPFSLYQDLALGAGSGGFETWAFPELLARGVATGAPPDAFNPRGQNWGLPPLIPERLRESGYRLFIDTLHRNLPPGGLVRLDHVMGLFRLFWIPRGREAREGAYVYYAARELLAILALESVRQKTLIIGEDLGTVSPRIRRELKRTGILSYRVFYFERGPERGFRPPEAYPHRAMATVTTQDLPTLTAFWRGLDIEVKRRLHLYPEPRRAEAETRAREQDRVKMVEALSGQGLLAEKPPKHPPRGSCSEAIRFGVLEYLAQSEAALLEVRLEDIFGLQEQQNLPGTTREHPNWRRKLPLTLEKMRQSPVPARLAARLGKYRKR